MSDLLSPDVVLALVTVAAGALCVGMMIVFAIECFSSGRRR
jgi:hypothetical protein